ncbi:hypothetical protein JKF63_02690 [Porcisia hertigi]|uniref:Uncharacterized protein n=1 Tax=Porcisia hertigi TaxID=2761500 RepID=A0A836LDS9_9TRYP|nr:hypothetical protein JKF63_02690 [Porcisia hertigi]
MSELLLKQLEQVLEPWDSLPAKASSDEGDGPASLLWATPPQSALSRVSTSGASTPPKLSPSPADSTGAGWPAEKLAGACVEYSRAATTKLELARAALALFASNAGVYRPFLIKLFRFLFDHLDELREEQGRMRIEWWSLQKGGVSSTANGRGGDFAGATPEEQNAVSAAFEKVRMTETRMAALVEEAAVQRDHFQSQLGMQKSHQYHLEDVLRHQVELTQILLDHHLYQDVVSGKQSVAVTMVAAATSKLPALRSVAGAGSSNGGGGGGGHGGRGACEGLSPARDAAATTRDILGLDSNNGPLRPPERRDAAYVQRLIARAERELVLERTEVQLRDLRAQHESLQSKVQSLLKLNARYARQSIELSARLSILHEHNIALATEVHLFQRDYVKVLQWVGHLQRDLQVARRTVLTMLQVQSDGEASLEEGEVEDRQKVSRYYGGEGWQAGETRWRPSAKGKDSESRVTYSFETAVSLAPAAATVETISSEQAAPEKGRRTPRGHHTKVALGTESEAQEARRLLPGERLRDELQELLGISDPERTGVKPTMLQTLHLLCRRSLQGGHDVGSVSPIAFSHSAQGWRSPVSVLQWAPPHGLHSDVPLHLRSRNAVRLLHLHPLVAEVLVHELLSQREELLWFLQQQHEDQQVRLRTGGRPGSRREGVVTVPSAFMPFQDYIALFVLVVWLNGLNGSSHLFPSMTRARLLEEVRARRGSSDASTHRMAAPTDTRGDAGGASKARDQSVASTSLWDLRYVLHTLRFTEEIGQLPAEGLQLTYALDKASLQMGVGPLTYAYGHASRGSVCDVLFQLLRAERSVFLGLCRAVEADILATAQEEQQQSLEALRRECQRNLSKDQVHQLDVAGRSPPPPPPPPPPVAAAGQPSTTTTTTPPPPLRGFIPVVQVVRILLAMYPGYSTATLQQLIHAAVADGTNAAENPAILYYEVLLPSRMLPGPTTVSMSMDLSMAAGTSFAYLFYTAICDDALESMQMVEDSVCEFAHGQRQSGSVSASFPSAAAAMKSGVVTATAQQITSLAFSRVPRSEAQCWGPSLKSAIYRWPRLRATILDRPPGVVLSTNNGAATDGATDVTGEGSVILEGEIITAAGSSGRSSRVHSVPQSVVAPSSEVTRSMSISVESIGHSDVSSVSRVPVGEVMPYLRRHLLLRRGLYDWAEATAAAPLNPSRASTEENSEAKENPLSDVTERAGSAITTKETTRQWSATHEDFIRSWDAQWARISVATTAPPLPSIGPTELAEFERLLKEVDPHRMCAWGSELVSRENPLMYPVTYAWEKRGSGSLEMSPVQENIKRRKGRHPATKKQLGKG